jgi:hypothetical protein
MMIIEKQVSSQRICLLWYYSSRKTNTVIYVLVHLYPNTNRFYEKNTSLQLKREIMLSVLCWGSGHVGFLHSKYFQMTVAMQVTQHKETFVPHN